MADQVTQDILLRLRANPRQARRALKKFENQSRPLFKRLQDNWLKVTAAVAGVAKAIDFVGDSFKTFAEDARLQAASAEADINRLQIAMGGLVDQTELMRLASAAMSGDVQVSQETLEGLARSMRVLRVEQGIPLEKSMTAIEKVLREGAIKQFEQLGFEVEGSRGDIEAINEEIDDFIRLGNQATDEMLELGGDEVQRNLTLVKDFWSEIKVLIGSAVSGTANFISEMIGLREATEETARAFAQLRGVRAAGEAFATSGEVRISAAEQEIDFGILGVNALRAQGVDTSQMTPDQVTAIGRALAAGNQSQVASLIFSANTSLSQGIRGTQAFGERGPGGPRGLGPSATDVGLGIADPGAISEQGGPLGGPSGLGGGAIPEGDASVLGDRGFDAFGGIVDEMQSVIDETTRFETAMLRAKGTLVDVFQDTGLSVMGTFSREVSGVLTEMAKSTDLWAEKWEAAAGKIVNTIGIQLVQRGVGALAEAAILAFTPGGQANALGLAGAGTAAIATGMTIVGVGDQLGFNRQPSNAGAGQPQGTAASGGRPAQVAGSGDENTKTIVILPSEFGAMSRTERQYYWSRAMEENGPRERDF